MADFIISEGLAVFSKFSSVGLYHLCNWGQNMLNIKKKIMKTIGMNQLLIPNPLALLQVHDKS